MNRYDCHDGESGLDVADNGELVYYEEHMMVVRELQSRLEKLNQKVAALQQENASLKKDAFRIDWLESCNESHGFCHTGWGEYRYYSYGEDGYPSVRQTLDAAMQDSKQ